MSVGAGFAMLVPARPGARVLEVSEADASMAEVLRSAGCIVTCVRGSDERAAAVRNAGFEVRLANQDDELASAGGPFDVVVLSIALGRTRGSERIVRDVRSILRAAADVLAASGRCVVFLPNPIHSFPVVAPLMDRLLGTALTSPARGPLLPRWSSATGIRRALESEGLVAVEAFAALPTARRIKFLVPLEGSAGAEFFFRSLVPRSRHAPRRAAAHLARITVSYGLLARWAPAFGIVASKANAH